MSVDSPFHAITSGMWNVSGITMDPIAARIM